MYELLFTTIAFHPAACYIRCQLQRTREMACDEAVAVLLLQPQAYARSILQIASAMAQAGKPGHALGMFEGGGLEERIRRVLQRSPVNLRRARTFFAFAVTSLVVVGVVSSGYVLRARGQSAFEVHMKQGVAAWNARDFRTASNHFSSAVAAEPSDAGAKLYLANSLMSEFYGQSQPDLRLRSSAVQQYRDVLARDPKNKQALSGMSALTMEAGQLREAYDWAAKLTAIDPDDKTAWYTRGVLAWTMVYPEYQRARQAAGGPPEKYAIPDNALRKVFRDQHLTQVEDGMQMLRKALALDSSFDAALAYLNLLYRIKAAMVDSATEAELLLADTDRMIQEALDIKRRHAAQAPGELMKLDVNSPPPGPPVRNTMLKAPPPPPPPPSKAASEQIASSLPRPAAAPNQPPLMATHWQVVASNDMPAMGLYRQLRARGFDAVLHAGTDGHTRVLGGPYFDEASAAKARSGLEAAGFRVLHKWE